MERPHSSFIFLLSIILLSGCGGDGTSPPPPQSYRVSGTVSGLHGVMLTLFNNGVDAITIKSDGSFAFPMPVQGGASYTVSATANSAWTTCTVTNGSGSPAADVTTVAVTCGAAQKNGNIVRANLGGPWGVAVDYADSIYFTSKSTTCIGFVAKMRPDGASYSTLGGQWQCRPAGVAVDAAGNVYVADLPSNAIKIVTPGNAITPVGSGFNGPYGVTVDNAGNVYVADTGNNAIKRIAVGGTITTLGSGFNAPRDVKVDSIGNVYVADTGNNAIKEIAADGTIKTLGSGFSGPEGLAIDAAGVVYVADTGNNVVKSIAPDGTVSILSTGIQFGQTVIPYYGLSGIALDSNGSLIASDANNLGEIIRLTAGS
ncbi:hypothetical protein [Collimonas sp.]|jgi:streptogramin lyase|uniref:hypothetical protein n=1 Tax=Collimonas sp. TaxID=1963772 RepID=UPI002B50B6DE|nr:hypothetical protein [Collimonas sp.]HWX02219.1 hypothetical protein [Collimonas sp.]